MDFPQYRKKFDQKSFYKITSFTSFEEIQLIGQRFFLHNVRAEKYFEQLQIRDMLATSIEIYQNSTEEEYKTQLKEAEIYLHEKNKNQSHS